MVDAREVGVLLEVEVKSFGGLCGGGRGGGGGGSSGCFGGGGGGGGKQSVRRMYVQPVGGSVSGSRTVRRVSVDMRWWWWASERVLVRNRSRPYENDCVVGEWGVGFSSWEYMSVEVGESQRF